jgi:hypothetical protein
MESKIVSILSKKFKIDFSKPDWKTACSNLTCLKIDLIVNTNYGDADPIVAFY